MKTFIKNIKKKWLRSKILADPRIKRYNGVFCVEISELTESQKFKEDSQRIKDLWDKYVDNNGRHRKLCHQKQQA